MNNEKNTKAVVITGASTGIGKAAAYHLDRLGYRVFAGVRKQSDAIKLRKESSERLVPIFMDVTDASMVAESAAQVAESVGEKGIVGLVNNAGIAIISPLEFLPIEELRLQLDVNVIGQLTVTQAYLPLIRKGGGRVVFISSISGRVAAPLIGPYSASKFALGALTDSLRRELLPWNIKVSLIEPGKIETPIWEKTIAASDDIADKLSKQANVYYGQIMESNRQRALKGGSGTSAEKVAEVVTKALFSRSPKTRYLVGLDAKLGSMLVKLFPDKVLDRMIALQRGIKRADQTEV